MTAATATLFPVPLREYPDYPDCPDHPRTTAKVRSAEELRAALRVAGPHTHAPDLAQLDRVLRMDSREQRVEVQAGVRWDALSAYLAGHSVAGAADLGTKAARFTMPATAGECVLRNCACPDGSSFAAHVVALALVTANGELRRASRTQQPELFQRVIGSHGLIAAVYSVTLDVASLCRAFSDAEPPVTLDAAQEPGATGDAGSTGSTMRLMVPPGNLQPFLADLRQAFDDFRLPICELSVRKALPDADSFLRWATAELAIVDVRLPARSTLPAQVAATQVRRALIASALAHGGCFDLTTGLDASRGQVEAAYPMFKAFLAEKRRCDPEDRLGGALYAHYLSLFRREPCEVRWTSA